MSNYKISVIIPVYNAQDTIERSINSVINQTIGFSSIELILYDDNSTDNTQKILEEYSEKHDNIVLILSDENSGYPGKGRNTGIEIASADYVMFMDNDDEYCPDMCETLYDEIIKEDADIVSCNHLNVDEISSEIILNDMRDGHVNIVNDKIVFLDDDVYDFKDVLVWSKIFRKSVIVESGVEFLEDRIAEDIYFMYLLLIYVNKIVYLKDFVGYVRHVQGDSLSNTVNYFRPKEKIGVLLDIYSVYKNNDVNADFSWLLSGIISFCLISTYVSNTLDNKKEIYDLLNHVYNLEMETGFDNSYVEPIFKIPNKLIMEKRFRLTIFYLKIMQRFYKSSRLRKFFRTITKNQNNTQ